MRCAYRELSWLMVLETGSLRSASGEGLWFLLTFTATCPHKLVSVKFLQLTFYDSYLFGITVLHCLVVSVLSYFIIFSCFFSSFRPNSKSGPLYSIITCSVSSQLNIFHIFCAFLFVSISTRVAHLTPLMNLWYPSLLPPSPYLHRGSHLMLDILWMSNIIHKMYWQMYNNMYPQL
jgi:hypothetical protein